jgi:hypothetical protein
MRTADVAALAVLIVGLPCATQAEPPHPVPPGVADYFRRLEPRGPPVRGIVAFRDLNGDGRDEVLVYVLDDRYCGSGGCNFYVFERTGKFYRKIAGTTVTERPIRVLGTSWRDWRDLGVGVKGDAAEPGREVQLRVVGSYYRPSNPSLARALVHARGEIVIPEDAESAPLY